MPVRAALPDVHPPTHSGLEFDTNGGLHNVAALPFVRTDTRPRLISKVRDALEQMYSAFDKKRCGFLGNTSASSAFSIGETTALAADEGVRRGSKRLHKDMKKIRSILGLTAGALLAVAATGCDKKDSGGGGGGNPGGGSGSKTSSYQHDTSEAQLFAQSGTKPSQPPKSSGTKTNTPSGGSGSKTNAPSGGSAPKKA